MPDSTGALVCATELTAACCHLGQAAVPLSTHPGHSELLLKHLEGAVHTE